MPTRNAIVRYALVFTSAAVIVSCGRSKPATEPVPAGGARAPASTAASTSAAARPSQITDDMVAQGQAIFNNGSCTKCHGPNGGGGPYGPNLAAGTWTHISGAYDEIIRLVTTGVPKAEVKDPSRRFAMNPRGGMTPALTDDQVKAVAAYVWTISHHR